MLAVLGLFVFQLNTAPYQQFQRTTHQSWPGAERVGRRASYQYTGAGDDKVTLSGSLAPEITGGRINIDALHIMADLGLSYPLLDGEGTLYGLYAIERVDETRTELYGNGAPRKIEFTLSLKRTDDSPVDAIGSLMRLGVGAL
ncbi:phage tail protein [Halorhodospira neutriphila]|uniref:Oxidoreductase n=1 Tax=Halorhodospira neutriphila TaxID=168379 RepID=A0ABS1E4G6_9GAMM|nr:phage tail protein [Halorhodospira neutriphila]MBK1725729.1 hypothetical protein [Halorhodospira neutriphila]